MFACLSLDRIGLDSAVRGRWRSRLRRSFEHVDAYLLYRAVVVIVVVDVVAATFVVACNSAHRIGCGSRIITADLKTDDPAMILTGTPSSFLDKDWTSAMLNPSDAFIGRFLLNARHHVTRTPARVNALISVLIRRPPANPRQPICRFGSESCQWGRTQTSGGKYCHH